MPHEKEGFVDEALGMQGFPEGVQVGFGVAKDEEGDFGEVGGEAGFGPRGRERLLPQGRAPVKRKPAVRVAPLREERTQTVALSNRFRPLYPQKGRNREILRRKSSQPVPLTRSYYHYTHA
jgi:hypothetical protein